MSLRTQGKKLTPAEHMKGFLACFKKQIEFGEFAGAGKDIPKGNDKRDAAIKDYQEKNRKDGEEITYKEPYLPFQNKIGIIPGLAPIPDSVGDYTLNAKL